MINTIINNILFNFTDILGDNLVGIYLHGSVAFGCFNPDVSDIDFIAVTKHVPQFSEKKRIIEFLLSLDQLPVKGIEMSIVLEKDCTDFVYPTPYCLHYSDYHKPFYLNDMDNHILKLQGNDKDLAAHFTVINNVGITRYGKDKDIVFSPVPSEYYLDSIKFDIESAKVDIFDNPVYIILNLCRVYAYMQDNIVLSKADGGKWGMENLSDFKNTINKAYNKYVYSTPANFTHNELEEFVQYMVDKIFA